MSRPADITAAEDPAATPFDYIIVGSGAGGGPLAARLALGGRRVLLIEAGRDPAQAKSRDYPGAGTGEVHQCPAYHAAATEDREMSWQFSVRHYADDERQRLDGKYDASRDPSAAGGTGRGGIQYPRSSGIGGCTGHHAMIIAAPNDEDWDHIARLTGDDSWRAAHMRGYFAKLERCLYVTAYQNFLRRLLGFIYRAWRWIVLQLDPRAVLDEGGHGRSGWQQTAFIDPDLVRNIAETDRSFVDVLARSATAVLHGSASLIGALKRSLFRMRIVQHIDLNDINTRRFSPEGVFLIPVGIGDPAVTPDMAKDANPVPREVFGSRVGVREFLLETAEKHPDRLAIVTGVHVVRVLFRTPEEGGPPQAAGVLGIEGDYLYEASPLQGESKPGREVRYFTRGEVILCGGAFNTPQLMMLSGIGDREHLADHGIAGLTAPDGSVCHPVVHLPGVGRNLQDRYEVSVISELARPFSTLDGVTFEPGDPDDPARRQWLENQTGLYATNGGTLAIVRRSGTSDRAEPDVFTFGAPVAFRGYYWGWSRELLRRTKGAREDQRNLWSWIILKAYTSNSGGTVRLRSADPFRQPEIQFHSFEEGPPGWQGDLAAIADAVKFIRRVNARNPDQFRTEIQPGPDKPDDTEALDEWIRTQAWGHHACGTCRIGCDAWQADPDALTDRTAVLDSRFRVHGVRGLRIVDASVFPKIPGYFIVTPIFMISEKAADTLLSDPLETVHPEAIRRREREAILARRAAARAVPRNAPPDTDNRNLPADTVGLAFSGGGVRSATFCLGLLQALAARNRLRFIDILSSVSGGGFTGGFLGRFFTRPSVRETTDPCGRVQETLRDSASAPLWWLRTQANYIFAGGHADLRQNLAIFWRNIFTVHLVIGALLFALFGLLRGASVWLPERLLPGPQASLPIVWSAWWWVPALVVLIGLLPGSFGYWLAPRVGSRRPHPFFALLAWLVLLGCSVAAIALPGVLASAIAAFVLLLSWVWQEAARKGNRNENPLMAERRMGLIVRNRLTRGLAEVLGILALTAGWVVIDSLAASIAGRGFTSMLVAGVAAAGPLLPFLRIFAGKTAQKIAEGSRQGIPMARLGAILGVPLAVFLLVIVDVLAHELFRNYPSRMAWGAVVSALLFSLAVGRAIDFLNLSSLHAAYSARIARTFQGATSDARIHGGEDADTRDVQVTHPDDDIPMHRYHPEESGGPLHLINVCISETVDHASSRTVRERKGIPMTIGPHCVSVGRRFFARWVPSNGGLPWWQRLRRWLEGTDRPLPGADLPPALEPLPAGSDPRGFHVLGSRDASSAPVESLTLGNWIAVSGAAFSTGSGRTTRLTTSLFMGLVNFRLGYWWDTGILPGERPGRFPPSIWKRIKQFPGTLFRMQSLLLSEWRARFPGPSARFWFLSDGGHFDVTGLYELLRRRVPLMIVADCGEDPAYEWQDMAEVTRQARLDFGAEITWADPGPGRAAGRTGWDAFDDPPPAWIREWINPEELGGPGQIGRNGSFHAAIARVDYEADSRPRWILLIKPSLTGRESPDLAAYALANPAFPQDPTIHQIFDDTQWESYRALGCQAGKRILRDA